MSFYHGAPSLIKVKLAGKEEVESYIGYVYFFGNPGRVEICQKNDMTTYYPIERVEKVTTQPIS